MTPEQGMKVETALNNAAEVRVLVDRMLHEMGDAAPTMLAPLRRVNVKLRQALRELPRCLRCNGIVADVEQAYCTTCNATLLAEAQR